MGCCVHSSRWYTQPDKEQINRGTLDWDACNWDACGGGGGGGGGVKLHHAELPSLNPNFSRFPPSPPHPTPPHYLVLFPFQNTAQAERRGFFGHVLVVAVSGMVQLVLLMARSTYCQLLYKWLYIEAVASQAPLQ